MGADFDLKHLRHLMLVAEELNFSRAAERAHLSQTAFSRSIQALEAGLDLQLLDRGTRSVRLTAAGRQLVTRAQRVLAEAADLAREVDHLAGATGGTLTFGASLMTTGGVLRGVVQGLRQRLPGVGLNIKVGQAQALQELLEQERIEFFVGYSAPVGTNPAFLVRPLPPQPASIFCSASHPLAKKGSPTRRQLLDYPWAAVQSPPALASQVRDWLGLSPSAALPIGVLCDNLDLLREAMRSSDLLLLTWASWLREELRSGSLIDLGGRLDEPLPPEMARLACAIVQLAGRTPSPAASHAIDLIEESARRAAKEDEQLVSARQRPRSRFRRVGR